MKNIIFFAIVVLTTGTITKTFGQTDLPSTATNQGATYSVLENMGKLKPASVRTQMEFDVENVKKFFPELVVKRDQLIPAGKGSMKGVSYETVDTDKMIPYLVKAIQEQQDEIKALKAALAQSIHIKTEARN